MTAPSRPGASTSDPSAVVAEPAPETARGPETAGGPETERAAAPVTQPPRAAPAEALEPGSARREPDDNGVVDLSRLGWLVTVLSCAVAAVILLLQGYYGYAAVTLAVAASAAINLR